MKVVQGNLKGKSYQYNCFATSLGINAFVIADSMNGESVIFLKKSADVVHTEHQIKYNLTIMEGILQTEYAEVTRNVSLNLAMMRALTRNWVYLKGI
ncbi:hypothetical protein [Heyndrickxia ginsengihumi]|uniref:hypothetical protein n=1 Tax=Heyndrickxia ginsengihumi TaxID=363870 RepID=UPI003D1960B9